MKPFRFFFPIALIAVLAGCGRAARMEGGVNVGNGRTEGAIVSYTSRFGFVLEYLDRLHLAVTSDDKRIVFDDSPFAMSRERTSSLRIDVFEKGRDQKLFDPGVPLARHAAPLRLEAERRFPGRSLRQIEAAGAIGFAWAQRTGDRRAAGYVFLTINYDLVVATLDERSDGAGAKALAAIVGTFRCRERWRVTGIRIETLVVRCDQTIQLRFRMQPADSDPTLAPPPAANLEACADFALLDEETGVPASVGLACGKVVRAADGSYEAELWTKPETFVKGKRFFPQRLTVYHAGSKFAVSVGITGEVYADGVAPVVIVE